MMTAPGGVPHEVAYRQSNAQLVPPAVPERTAMSEQTARALDPGTWAEYDRRKKIHDERVKAYEQAQAEFATQAEVDVKASHHANGLGTYP